MSNHIADANKMVSDTPRTDAHNWNEGHYDDPLHSLLDFAKQLERELNAANEKAQRYYEAILKHKSENEHLTKKIHQLYEGAEEQKRTIKELQEVNEYLREKCLTLEYGRTSK